MKITKLGQRDRAELRREYVLEAPPTLSVSGTRCSCKHPLWHKTPATLYGSLRVVPYGLSTCCARLKEFKRRVGGAESLLQVQDREADSSQTGFLFHH